MLFYFSHILGKFWQDNFWPYSDYGVRGNIANESCCELGLDRNSSKQTASIQRELGKLSSGRNVWWEDQDIVSVKD